MPFDAQLMVKDGQQSCTAHRMGSGDPMERTGMVLALNMTSHPLLTPVDQLMSSCMKADKQA